jgi:hypothetical protein
MYGQYPNYRPYVCSRYGVRIVQVVFFASGTAVPSAFLLQLLEISDRLIGDLYPNSQS